VETAGQLLLVVFLILANGFFVAAEFALVKVRLSQLEVLADGRSWTARVAKGVATNLDAYLSACQLGITIASLALGWVGEPFVEKIISPTLHRIGLGAYSDTISLYVGFIVITFLHITIGEQVPKILAIRTATGTSMVVSPPLKVFYFVFRPFIWFLNASSNWMLRLLGFGVRSHKETHTEDELRLILAESAEGGSLSLGERRLMENVLDLEDKTARRIMVPRNDIAYLDVEDSLQENLKCIAESRHTRFPLCDGGLDRVIGMVHAKRVLRMLVANADEISLPDLASKVPFVPETVKLDHLMREFLTSRVHLALVVNEYGSVTGMVTFEDVLEELVGPIQDEFDRELPPIVRRAGGKFLADGSCPLDLFLEHCPVQLPAVEAESVGGLMVELLGHIPEERESVRVGRYDLVARTVTDTQVKRIEIIPVPQAVSVDDRPADATAVEAPARDGESTSPDSAIGP
jgi:CBS domain containing-hemolysin-like protein